MFANVKKERERERERERDWYRHVKVNIASAYRQVEREVCVCVCVCVLFEFRQFVFYSRNSSTYFKVLCRSLQKKSDRTRCLAVSILEYNLGPKITGSEVQY